MKRAEPTAVETYDFRRHYVEDLENIIDIEAIKRSGIRIGDRAILYAVENGHALERVPLLKDLTAYDIYVRSVTAKDGEHDIGDALMVVDSAQRVYGDTYALLPLYLKLRVSPVVLTVVAGLANGALGNSLSSRTSSQCPCTDECQS